MELTWGSRTAQVGLQVPGGKAEDKEEVDISRSRILPDTLSEFFDDCVSSEGIITDDEVSDDG